jgi:acetyl-CoA acetyltransferase
MRPAVVVADAHVVEPGNHWSLGWSDLVLEAAADLVGGPPVEAILCAASGTGNAENQGDPAGIIADRLGLTGVTAVAVDCGQASAASAINLGWTLITHGAYRDILVVGAAKVSDHTEAERLAVFDRSLDQDAELSKGLDFTAQAGLLADLYLRRNGVSPHVFAAATAANKSAWARRNGQREVGLAETLMDLVVAPPLLRGDFPQVLDGAAALRLRAASRSEPGRLTIAAVSARSDIASPFERRRALDFAAVGEVVAGLMRDAASAAPDFMDFDVPCSVVDVLAQESARARLAPADRPWRANPSGGAQGRGYVDGQGALYQFFDLLNSGMGRAEGLAISVSGFGARVFGSRLSLGGSQ